MRFKDIADLIAGLHDEPVALDPEPLKEHDVAIPALPDPTSRGSASSAPDPKLVLSVPLSDHARRILEPSDRVVPSASTEGAMHRPTPLRHAFFPVISDNTSAPRSPSPKDRRIETIGSIADTASSVEGKSPDVDDQLVPTVAPALEQQRASQRLSTPRGKLADAS